jgi:hypothetical protein
MAIALDARGASIEIVEPTCEADVILVQAEDTPLPQSAGRIPIPQLQPALDRARLGGLGFIALLVAAEPPVPAPAHQRHQRKTGEGRIVPIPVWPPPARTPR